MDLVKSHLMSAGRGEVEELRDKISKLEDTVQILSRENEVLRTHVPAEVLGQLQAGRTLMAPPHLNSLPPPPPAAPALGDPPRPRPRPPWRRRDQPSPRFMQTSGPGLRSDRTPTLEQFIWENLHAVLFPTAVSSCIPTVTSHSSDLGVYLVEIYRDDGPALDPRVHCMFSFLPMKCADSGLNIYTNIAGSLGTEVPTNERYSHPEAAH